MSDRAYLSATGAPAWPFLAIEDAARFLGATHERLRQLARTRQLAYRGSLKDPLFSMGELIALRAEGSRVRGAPSFEEMGAPTLPPPLKDRSTSGPPFAPNTVVRANVLDVLRILPDDSVAAVISSPPYWGQRVYADEVGVCWRDGCLNVFGREDAPEEYVVHTLEILEGLTRVLRDDGTIWWNIADTYMTRTIIRTSSMDRVEHYRGKHTRWAGNPHRRDSYGHSYLKDKDLALVPFQITMGAQKLGYYVRLVIVWSKQQPLDDLDKGTDGADRKARVVESARLHVPEIVRDRPVSGHEYILLLTKSKRYQYHAYGAEGSAQALNVRTVWTFPPVATKGLHGARFPDELPRRCIELGTTKGDLVFDPFSGEGTTLRVARDLGRQYFGCDTSATYVRLASEALHRPAGSWAARAGQSRANNRASQSSVVPAD